MVADQVGISDDPRFHLEEENMLKRQHFTPARGARTQLGALAVSTAVAMIVLHATQAAAGEPVAIIEQVQAPSTRLQFMDFVEAGRVIRLHSGESLSLGYFTSCIQERITGGSIEIGTEQSSVEGGDVTRQRVECDGGHINLDTTLPDTSGVLILRKIDPGKSGSQTDSAAPLPEPQVVLYATSPMISLSTPGALVRIDRLDVAEPRIEFRVDDRYLDLAATDKKLTAGGLYRIEASGHAIIFRIEPAASRRDGPVIGRLLHL